jgi:predicted ABC-type ATPase
MQAGRVMLGRIKQLLQEDKDFAFETTLATRSYINLIRDAKAKGYEVTLLYFWLHSPEQAKERVAERVAKGGHNIEDKVVERRYYRGINNFFKLYSPVCDNWMLIDNTNSEPVLMAKGHHKDIEVEETGLWDQIQRQL